MQFALLIELTLLLDEPIDNALPLLLQLFGSFGEVTIGISANGAVVEAVGGDGKVKVAGYTYKESGLTFNLGGTAIIGLKK